MGRHDHIVQLIERELGWRWMGVALIRISIPNVEYGSGDPPGLQCEIQVLFRHERTTADIDEEGSRRQRREHTPIDDATGLLGQRTSQYQKVRAGSQIR